MTRDDVNKKKILQLVEALMEVAEENDASAVDLMIAIAGMSGGAISIVSDMKNEDGIYGVIIGQETFVKATMAGIANEKDMIQKMTINGSEGGSRDNKESIERI